jgi:uncharacterized protein YcbK (DUF882 family)
MKTYLKGRAVQLSRHFGSLEFDCKCQRPECTETKIDNALITLLESIRAQAGPLIILCGYRCPAHNAEIGGAPHSQHKDGKAADITARVPIPFLFHVCDAINPNGGVGEYHTFVHVDTRGKTARWNLAGAEFVNDR